MKKIYLIIALVTMVILTPVSAKESNSKKVQTNYQYKLVCGYYNGSSKLTWGSQENIGDYKNSDGSISNSEKACGETPVTKNYPIGDVKNGNLPKNVKMIYDSCNGSTGKQKAAVGQSCTSEGRTRTCTVKWTGYCYKETKINNSSRTSKISLEDYKIYAGDSTDVNNAEACDYIKVDNEEIASYNESLQEVKGLSYGKTYIECYKNNKLINKKRLSVKAKKNYRYINRTTVFYNNENLSKVIRQLNIGKKVNYLGVQHNGYCKVLVGNKEGYVLCNNLNLQKPKNI